VAIAESVYHWNQALAEYREAWDEARDCRYDGRFPFVSPFEREFDQKLLRRIDTDHLSGRRTPLLRDRIYKPRGAPMRLRPFLDGSENIGRVIAAHCLPRVCGWTEGKGLAVLRHVFRSWATTVGQAPSSLLLAGPLARAGFTVTRPDVFVTEEDVKVLELNGLAVPPQEPTNRMRRRLRPYVIIVDRTNLY
jgi:hypothetical protein